MPDREHTLYLLDGMALVYRAHFAFATNPIRTAAGRNTSAIYGFTNTLLELISKQKPTHLAVVFDTSAPTARHKEFPAYKAQRQEMPEELSAAIPDVKRLIRAFNLPVLELDGYEADDIIGTLAREAAEKDFTTYMVTPDKDFGQLVNEHVLIYKPGRMGDDHDILGVPEVLAKWGIVRCDQVRDILGFAGDTSDNIPGIPGIGEKTAQKLIAQYDSMENTLDRFAEQKGKLKESLQKFRDQAILSKRLATIDVNVPLPFEPEVLRIGPRDEPALKALLSEFEFNAIGRRLFGDDFKAGRGAASSGGPGYLLPGSRSSGTGSDSVAPSVVAAAAGAPVPGGGPLPSSVSPDNLLSGSPRSSETTRSSQSGSATTQLQHPPIPPVPVALRTIDDVKPQYLISSAAEVKALLEKIEAMPTLSIAIDSDPQQNIRGIAFAQFPGVARYVALEHILAAKINLAGRVSAERPLIGHDIKPGLRAFLQQFRDSVHSVNSSEIPLLSSTPPSPTPSSSPTSATRSNSSPNRC